MKVWRHKEDCEVVRGDNGDVKVYDCDGDILFCVSYKYSDAQIWKILNIANRVYNDGFNDGVGHTQSQIARAMGLKP